MKKNNVKTTEKKQRRQQKSKARRVRRVAERNAVVERQVKRQLKVLAQLLKTQNRQIEELEAKLKSPTPEFIDAADKVIAENSAVLDDLAQQEAAP